MKKKKYMGKIIALLFVIIYVFVTVNLLVLYNYNNDKIISDVGYDFNSMNGCPIKPTQLHLKQFFYSSQNEKIITKIINNKENSENTMSFFNHREIVLNN